MNQVASPEAAFDSPLASMAWIVAVVAIIGFAALAFMAFDSAIFGAPKAGAGTPLPLLLILGFFAVVLFAATAYSIVQYIKSAQIQLRLDKQAYAPGEAITGSVMLALGSDTSAQGLQASFYGIKRRGKHRVRICERTVSLGDARVYRKGEAFRFSITVPVEAAQQTDFFAWMARRPNWYVAARLAIPNGVDIARRERVVLQMPPPAQAANGVQPSPEAQ